MVLYSGRDDDQQHEGEAALLKKGMEKCLMEWKTINSMLMKIRKKGKHINITIIQCYMHRPTTVNKRAKMHSTTGCKPS